MTAPLALTAGEPAGIGPDLCIHIAQNPPSCRLVIIADPVVLKARAEVLGLPFDVPLYTPDLTASLSILPIASAVPVIAGQLNSGNSAYVLESLKRATEGCLSGQFSGMVTGPVHKGVINEAGYAFTGHTEFLAELTHTSRVVMMLAGAGMRVALVTTHLPIKEVAAAITPAVLEETLRILNTSLQMDFGLLAPRILVAGLNPHAGEGGHLGREEIDIIDPVMTKLRATGMNLLGPLPADTLFQRKYLDQCDAVLAMYHDQGLPVLKHASFGEGVNVTLGLPIIRTSVDHGTALDLAGTGNINDGSLRVAINIALHMVAMRAATPTQQKSST